MLKDAGVVVGGEFAARWITAEAALNHQLRQAFDNRYQSPQHLRAANKLIEKSMRNLLKAAKAEPDREATLDRAAVAAAVRGTSRPPPDRPIKYGDLSDGEFRKELAKFGL